MTEHRPDALEGRLLLSAQLQQEAPAALLAESDPVMTPVDQVLSALSGSTGGAVPARFAPSTAVADVNGPAAGFVASEGSNNPFGVAQGIFPGRVAWARDPAATSTAWDGANPATGYWWEDRYNNQAAIDALVGQTVRWITGRSTDEQAWDTLFRSFNIARGLGNVGYQAGEKIVIKVNLNNTWAWEYSATDSRQYQMGNNNWADTSPHVMLALLRQLVQKAGVAQQNITLIEPGRYFVDRLFNKLHPEFPDVHYVDRLGINGRESVIRSATTVLHTSVGAQDAWLPQQYLDAKYMINLATLKKHEMGGVTTAGKNHYGSFWTTDNSNWSPSSMHNTLPVNLSGMGQYSQMVDVNGHPDTGGKTLLYMVDALWGGWHSNREYSVAQKWQMAPFYNTYPSSILASQDFVAIESVALDFVSSEDSLHSPPLGAGQPVVPYADNVLHEAALASNSASRPAGVAYSGTIYDPDGDGKALTSLGVHEHWNNATAKQYSRNLATGKGIELVSATPNAAPTDIVISSNTIAENMASNTIVGSMSATDPDGSEPFWYDLVGGQGAADNGSFWIDGAELKTKASLDFEAGSVRSIRVRVQDHVFKTGQTAEQVLTGYGFTEGPAVDAQGRVWFTAKGTNRILRYDPATGQATTITSTSNSSNGLDIDSLGRLLACEESLHRVTRTDNGVVSVLASTYGGLALNSPNDVVAAANGGVYFTDPNWGTHPQPYEAVYYVDPSGTLFRVITDLVRPNGVAISYDGLTLYVADDTGRAIYAYDIQTSGLPTNKRLFASIPAGGNHGPDGLVVDGNEFVYAALDHAVKVWDRRGVLRGTLTMAEDPTNLAFAPDGRTLYITTQQGSLYRIVLDTMSYEEAMVINVGNRVEGPATVTGISQDTGTAGDGITSDRTLVILGTSDPDLPVSIFRDGSLRGTAMADGAGQWSFDDTASSLADGQYSFTAQGSDTYGGTTAMSGPFDVRIDGTAPTQTGTTANGGVIQRSMVRSIEVTFSESVDLAPGALALQTHGGGSVTGVNLAIANPSADKSHYILSFAGSAVVASSLPDGVYDLVVQASGVSDGAGNVLAGDSTFVFHRLFGDSDGNRVVNAADYTRLRMTYGRTSADPLFNSAFDYDGNTVITPLDLTQFRKRYGRYFIY